MKLQITTETGKNLANIFQNRQGVVFCGAGISLEPPAGLPDWNKLRDYTLEAIVSKEMRLQKHLPHLTSIPTIAQSGKGLPPEIVASEIAANCQGYFQCFAALEDGEPNANHLYIAQMAKAGLLKYIITTNFDLFIERALEKNQIEYRIYRSEEEFTAFDNTMENPGVHIFKIHGCISLPDTITSTVEQEGKGLSFPKLQVLVSLYKEYYIVFWGYSGADLKIHLDYLGMVSNQKEAKGFIWNFYKNDHYQEPINPYVQKLAKLYGETANIVHGKLPDVFEQFISTENHIERIHYTQQQEREWQQQKNLRLQAALVEWAEQYVGDSHACNIFGNLLLYSGNWQEALECFKYTQSICEDENDHRGWAAASNNIGCIYMTRGEYHSAIDCFEKALKFTKLIDNHKDLANYTNNIGRGYRLIGELDKALFYYQEAERLDRANGNQQGLVVAINNIGMVYRMKLEYQKALEYYQKAEELARALGDKTKLVAQLNNIGMVYQHTKEYQQALTYFDEVYEIAYALNDLKTLFICLNNMGSVHRGMKDYEKTLSLYKEALAMAEKIGDMAGIATASRNLGVIYEEDFNDLEQAEEYYGKHQQCQEAMENRDSKPEQQDKEKTVEELKESGQIWEEDTLKVPRSQLPPLPPIPQSQQASSEELKEMVESGQIWEEDTLKVPRSELPPLPPIPKSQKEPPKPLIMYNIDLSSEMKKKAELRAASQIQMDLSQQFRVKKSSQDQSPLKPLRQTQMDILRERKPVSLPKRNNPSEINPLREIQKDMSIEITKEDVERNDS